MQPIAFSAIFLNLQGLIIGTMIHSIKMVTLIGEGDLKLSMLMLEDLIVLIIGQKCAADFKNQRQSVAYVWSEKSSEREEKYKARLLIVLGIVRFLLLQALAFRGHDESSSSSNKGNFLEMLEWYKNKDPKAASVLGVNAPKNCQMILAILL
jgi:hypothetical protein